MGDTETIEEKLAHHRLELLGHVGRMEDNRMRWQVLFVTFLQHHPAHGPGRDGKIVLSGTCCLAICLLLVLPWHVSSGRLAVSHIPLLLVMSIACSLLSALFVISLFLTLVIGIGTRFSGGG